MSEADDDDPAVRQEQLQPSCHELAMEVLCDVEEVGERASRFPSKCLGDNCSSCCSLFISRTWRLGTIAVRQHHLESLASLLDESLLEKALEVVDNKRISRLCAEHSHRELFVVRQPSGRGSAGERYVCFDAFCTCPVFVGHVSQAPRTVLFCKHLLAVALARGIGPLPTKVVSDFDFANQLVDLLPKPSEGGSSGH